MADNGESSRGQEREHPRGSGQTDRERTYTNNEMEEIISGIIARMNISERNQQQPQQQPQQQRPSTNAPWKPAELGFFFPDMPMTWGRQDIVDREDKTYYRSVYAFTNRVKVVDSTKEQGRVQQNLDTCLRGEAERWWTTEIDRTTRTGLIHDPQGVRGWTKALEKRFKILPSQVLQNLANTRYTIADVRARRSPTAYLTSICSAAKQCGQGETEFSQVLHAWSNLDLSLRETIDEPQEGTTIPQFMDLLLRKQSN